MNTDTRPLVDRITQGKMHTFPIGDLTILGQAPPLPGAHVAHLVSRPDMEANAELITDAFNTAHRTRRTPSELAAERDELIVALREHLKTVRLYSGDAEPNSIRALQIQQAEDLLNRCQS